MTTPISSHVKDKNNNFSAHEEDMIIYYKIEYYIAAWR